MVGEAEGALASLYDLHAEIDREVGLLSKRHAERLQCRRGCSACCVDDLTVESVEAARIQRAHPELLRDAAPHPPGACAFLDADGSCRVYADRPSVCRSQGLPLRFFLENDEDEIEERRDICPLNLEGGPPLEQLAEEDCWLLGPFELRLAAIADAYASEPFGGERGREFRGESREQSNEEASTHGKRVALRDLFARAARPQVIPGQREPISRRR